MEFKKEELVKSPLNYTGGKYKLLPQILPLLPDNIDTFVDLFAGGCNVGVNVKANKIICNDIENHVINLISYFKYSTTNKDIVKDIGEIVDFYGLSNTEKYGYEYYGTNSSKGVGEYNKKKYLKLREDFNKDTNNSLMFFATIVFSFSNQIRFNSKGEFNVAVNKRDFNKNIKKNTVNFINKLNKLNIDFLRSDFRNINLNNLGSDDLIYCDPPYLVACAGYNEQDGWNEECEKDLLQMLDKLHKQGTRFALSNVLENKGKSNDILKEWSNKYNVHYLNNTYGNCNYHAKDKSKTGTIEVLITNY